MKRISELSTDEALDVLCEITPFVNNIAIDETLIAELKRKLGPEGAKSRAEIFAMGAEKINTLAPMLLKTHRGDIYGILSIFAEKEIGEIAKQNFLVTALQLKTLLKDKELVVFFKSCAEREAKE